MRGRAVELSRRLVRVATHLACIAALFPLLGCSSSMDPDNALPVNCLDKPEPGRCGARVPAYYYDYPSNTCRAAPSGGCRGQVRFESREACEAACVGRR
jgi:hypothetical protein